MSKALPRRKLTNLTSFISEEPICFGKSVRKEKAYDSLGYQIFLSTVLDGKYVQEEEILPMYKVHQNYYDNHRNYGVCNKNTVFRKLCVDSNAKWQKKESLISVKSLTSINGTLNSDSMSTKPDGWKEDTSRKSKIKLNKEIAYDNDLAYERDYLEKIFQDEDLRYLFLHTVDPDPKKYPCLRLLMESHLEEKFKLREIIQKLTIDEIQYLDKLCLVKREQIYWDSLRLEGHEPKTIYKIKKITKQRIRKMTKFFNRVEKLRYYLASLQLKKAHTDGEKLLRIVNRWPERSKRSYKWRFIAEINYLLGLICLEQDRLDDSEKYFLEDSRLGFRYNIEESKARCQDNLGRIYALKGDYSKAIETWTERYKCLTTELEKAWICYEIGRCCLFAEDLTNALLFGQRCLDHAGRNKSHNWEVNGHLLIASVLILIGSIDEFLASTNLMLSLAALSRAYRCSQCLCIPQLQTNMIKVLMEVFSKIYEIDSAALTRMWSADLYDTITKATVKAKLTTAALEDDNKISNVSNASSDKSRKKSRSKYTWPPRTNKPSPLIVQEQSNSNSRYPHPPTSTKPVHIKRRRQCTFQVMSPVISQGSEENNVSNLSFKH